jgi:chemotaxis response regulator CheB
MAENDTKVFIIGTPAGGMQVLTKLLSKLPAGLLPFLLCSMQAAIFPCPFSWTG